MELLRRKEFTYFLFVIIGILLILTIIFSILYSTIKENKIEINDICLTPYCIERGNYFLESIDETINPCENFYKFTCGKWIDKIKIPDDDNYYDTFAILQDKTTNQIIDLLSSSLSNQSNSIINLKKLYLSCINEQQIEKDNIDYIISFINNQFGGWPILQEKNLNKSNISLLNLLIKINQFNKFPLFYIQTYIDENNSSSYSIYIGQSNLPLTDRSYYLNETNITIAYRKFIKDFILLLTNNTSNIDQHVQQIFYLEKQIAQIFWTTAQQYVQLSNRTNFGNISSILNTTFNFTDYISNVYQLSNINIKNEDIIIINEIEVLKNISILLNKQSLEIIKNYFIWYFLLNYIEYMPKRFRNLKQEFYKIFKGIKNEKKRNIQCTQFINKYMGFAISNIYIHKYFDQYSQQQSIEMIKNIKYVFEQMINESIWMDDKSKSNAIEKMNLINQRIGYPDNFINNLTYLEEKYSQFKFNSSYFKNILLINKINLLNNLKKLHKTIDKKDWTFLSPIDINAFYRPSFNDITFTAAILQTPFFNKDAPKYLNYGGIGMVIGHELTHGFDTIGREFDKNGNKIVWWTNETIKAFEKQKQCFIDQYNNYTLNQININVNGKQTQGENIADNGAIKQAFFAYQKWLKNNPNTEKKLPGLTKYSFEQMFFINFAQLWCSKTTDQFGENEILTGYHSPADFRVIGPTSNFIEFDRVFECQPGQTNSRINKCIVW